MKTAPPKHWPLPKFKPLHIDNWDHCGSPNLPPNVDIHDPFRLFSLFFTDEIVDKLMEWTNKYTELYPLDKKMENPRVWQLICRQKLYAYLKVLIYIGITIEPAIKDYWKDLNIYSTKYIVK